MKSGCWGFRFRPNIETFGGVAMMFAEWFYATKCEKSKELSDLSVYIYIYEKKYDLRHFFI